MRATSRRAEGMQVSLANDPDVARDAVFKREFDFVDHDQGHRLLLQDDEWTAGGQTIGDDLFTLGCIDQFVERIDMCACARQQKGERHACAVVARTHAHTARNRWLSRPPIRNANGMMNAIIAAAIFQPCSLMIIITLAMQGTNRVIVTMPTTAWMADN